MVLLFLYKKSELATWFLFPNCRDMNLHYQSVHSFWIYSSNVSQSQVALTWRYSDVSFMSWNFIISCRLCNSVRLRTLCLFILCRTHRRRSWRHMRTNTSVTHDQHLTRFAFSKPSVSQAQKLINNKQLSMWFCDASAKQLGFFFSPVMMMSRFYILFEFIKNRLFHSPSR